ncbi:hypothetical protein FHR22_003180 [Sphingopyxis panaciterrae]|uniref:hypothetical protein n=1 Tax=Sphingopyxis panaciterrae TaxID=363841 RepID=UPI00141E4ACB|nr:hypothetical protein [Sphingopyxis panaciterrae]NIJ38469.1 hypothetical protein [Sphingopyxis panaciterrae]
MELTEAASIPPPVHGSRPALFSTWRDQGIFSTAFPSRRQSDGRTVERHIFRTARSIDLYPVLSMQISLSEMNHEKRWLVGHKDGIQAKATMQQVILSM